MKSPEILQIEMPHAPGALCSRARAFTDAMPVSATTALAGAAYGEQLLPDSLESALHERVSQAVQAVVLRTGS